MRKPIFDAYDRMIMHGHRDGNQTVSGAFLYFQLAVLKLRREVCDLLLMIHHKIQGK